MSQRRGLFFKIPAEWEQELSLWELTVFKYAGEYLAKVLEATHDAVDGWNVQSLPGW